MIRPLVKEIPFCKPLDVFSKVSQQPGAVLLESADEEGYSFIGVDPFECLQLKNEDPFVTLEQQLKAYTLQSLPGYPPFQGGIMGFFAYDLIQYLEVWPKPPLDDMQFPDISVGFYDVVIAFDHAKQKSFIFSSGLSHRVAPDRLAHAQSRIAWVLTLLQQPAVVPSAIKKMISGEIQSNFTQENYCQAVREVKDYILAGDIFEANISQRFQACLTENATPFDLYLKLRQINPAPFSAFISHPGVSLVSASPERFIKKEGGKVEVRPIKGTRPRSKNLIEDEKLAETLLHSEKDRAENIMIVDLMRNDLSKVCLPDSVIVEKLCGLESFTHVHHLVSVITGELRAQTTVIDLLKAVFPGGSITGAPKLRAMEIISEIEPTARGPYCGGLGYIGFDGAMDLAMTIRTFCIKDKTVTFQAGGAIVLDSEPGQEYQETLDKVQSLKKVLYGACDR